MQVEDAILSHTSSVPMVPSAPAGPMFDSPVPGSSSLHHSDNGEFVRNANSGSPAGMNGNDSYDEIFPALPNSAVVKPLNPANSAASIIGKANNRLHSTITQIVKVKAEERKYDENDSFGEKESVRTCKSITKDTNATIEMSISKDNSLTFLINGKINDVNEAKRRILTHFQTQANKSISIPKDYHKMVLGKAGQRLKDLEKETMTKILVPPMNDPSEIITVTGTKEGIVRAIQEIKNLSDDLSRKAFERISVPKIYLPFVCGPNNVQLNRMMAESHVKITIMPPSVSDEITINGEKDGVARVKQQILSIVQQMEETCATVSVEVAKSQHKYVIGPKGATIAEILEKTGVSVEMPSCDTTNTIILRGPQDKLGHALNMVYEKANSILSVTVDVPNWIHRYIIGKKGDDIRKLKEEFPKVFVEFMDKEDKIRIEGPTNEVKGIKEKIVAKANQLISQMTFATLAVDAKYYKHIIGKSGANINRIKDQTDTMITLSDTNIIRIEGSKQGVEEAKRELEEMIHKLENEVEEEITIDHNYHSLIIGPKGEKIREIYAMFNQEVQITFPNANEKKNIVKVRGPKDEVKQCIKYLRSFVKELAENRYTLEVPIYKQYHKMVIGKGGNNIKRIKEDTNTKITLPSEGEKSDVIKVTGKRQNVEEARDRILQIQNEQANIVSEEITVPTSSSVHTRKILKSIADDCNGVSIRFPPPNSEKVLLRGPKEDVEKVKQQLNDLAKELKENSFTAEVKAKPQHHRFLIGKNGCNINKIRESTGCRIFFPSEQNEDQESITIIGKKDEVEKAKKELLAAIKEIDHIVEEEIDVDPKHHKSFAIRSRSSGQSLIQKISDDCGGISIMLPKMGNPSSKVKLRGSKECIEAAKLRILEAVDDFENQVTIECIISNEHHRSIIGRGFIKLQELNETYKVQIKMPDRPVPQENYNEQNYEGADHNGEELPNGNGSSPQPFPSPSDIILITGKREKCEEAKQALLDSVPIKETINVPYDYHRAIIGAKGQTIKELSANLDVYISVPQSSEHLDTITIKGSPSNVRLAKEAIDEKMSEIDADNEERKLKSHEVKLEVPAEYFPKIIGKKGMVINKIRDDHDVQINLPARGSEDENTITIVGYQDKAEGARDEILGIVNKLNSLVKLEVRLDSRIHSRLIGARGRSIRKVMDEYKVEIKFPRTSDPDPDIVVITGNEQDVEDAKEHLLELQDEYMEDVDNRDYRPSHREEESHDASNPFANVGAGVNNGRSNGPRNNNGVGPGGFVVKNAPWEQKRPDMASTQEFPSFGKSAAPAAANNVSWGPRK